MKMQKSSLIKKSLNITWVTFHGGYDFVYLIKMLIRGEVLPFYPNEFYDLIKLIFGPKIFDMKHVIRHRELYGGLENIASTLGVKRRERNAL